MKHFAITIILILIFSTTSHSSNNWRSYQRECGGNVKCMKLQAAAYQEFLYGDHNRNFVRRCKNAYISRQSKNYYAALRCVRNLQKRKEEAATRNAQKQYYETKREVITKERRYQKCRSRGRDAEYCAKRYLD